MKFILFMIAQFIYSSSLLFILQKHKRMAESSKKVNNILHCYINILKQRKPK